MLSILIPTLITAFVFISYNAAVLSNFGVPVPASLIDTFYLFNTFYLSNSALLDNNIVQQC